jgi:hypothetical protein
MSPCLRLIGASVGTLCIFASLAEAGDKLRVPLADDLGSPPSVVTVTGTLTQGAECLAIQADDGRYYSLIIGNRATLRPGDHVRVHGHRAEASVCMGGPTIIVDAIEKSQARDFRM